MPDRPTITRRRMLGLLAAAPAVAACGNATVPALKTPAAAPHVKIGFVVPQSGPAAAIGTDVKRGWDLLLQEKKGSIGTYIADVVTADEGTTPQAATAAVQKLLQQDKVDIVVGLVDTAATLAVIPIMNAAKKLLLVAGASGIDVTRKADSGYVWRTSYTDPQLAAPMGAQLAQSVARDGVYVVGPSDNQGTATLQAFQVAFESGGGTIAATARLAPGVNAQKTITQIQRAGPKATYCALQPADAVAFLQQYAQAGLAATIPLYGSGPMTDGAILTQDGQAATGVQTTLHYSDQLTNAVNTPFVAAYKAAYQATPTCWAVQGYDAALVLGQALGDEQNALDGDTMSNQMGKGDTHHSPRGDWKFEEQSPLQNVYLRKVQEVGGALVNAVQFDLGVTGQPAG